jgi:hypothetical protein
VAETAGIADPDRLDHRFVGAMKLRPDADVVAGLFSPATTALGERALPA